MREPVERRLACTSAALPLARLMTIWKFLPFSTSTNVLVPSSRLRKIVRTPPSATGLTQAPT